MAIETLKLFSKLSFPLPSLPQHTDPRLIAAMNLEAAALGYTFTTELIRALGALGNASVRTVRDTLIGDLSAIKGADKTYTRLFNDFPYSTPEQHEYMERRVLGHMASMFGISLGGNQLTPLSCGHVIDSALFDVTAFGACPICQHAVPELSSPDIARYDFKAVTPLCVIGFSVDGFLAEANTMLARQSSLSEDEKTFLRSMTSRGTELKAPEIMFRETMPFVYATFGPDAVRYAISGATDYLRIAAYLSDDNADLSLKANTKYKLSTSQRKQMIAMLDGLVLTKGADVVAEDMMRHRERWLRLGEKLKPALPMNVKRYPRLAEVFDRLRNHSGDITTFNRVMEKNIRSQTIDLDFVRMMTKRPAEFARKLDFMLRTTDEPRYVVAGFRDASKGLTEKLLHELRKYVTSRDDGGMRLFFPKGQQNKVQVVEDKRAPLPVGITDKLVKIIDAELMSRYAGKPLMGSVFIDPELRNIILPFNRRGDSSTSAAVAKGSRVPFVGDILRMFVWWQNGDHSRVDVDLSIVYFSDDFTQTGQVSYTNLRSGNIVVHSGDIQNAPAPKGASEFIDIDVKAMAAKHRYVAMSVLSFTGQKFSTFPCHAGYMERDSLGSGKVYEPESVALKFDLNSPNTSHMPLIFDLVERKVIVADLTTANSRYGRVDGQMEKQTVLTKAMLSLPDRKPTVYDLVYLNAKARGEIVEDRVDADQVFDIADAGRIIEEGVA